MAVRQDNNDLPRELGIDTCFPVFADKVFCLYSVGPRIPELRQETFVMEDRIRRFEIISIILHILHMQGKRD